MKKPLKKKMKKSLNAIRYFSGETSITKTITTVNTECYLVISVSSCPC